MLFPKERGPSRQHLNEGEKPGKKVSESDRKLRGKGAGREEVRHGQRPWGEGNQKFRRREKGGAIGRVDQIFGNGTIVPKKYEDKGVGVEGEKKKLTNLFGKGANYGVWSERKRKHVCGTRAQNTLNSDCAGKTQRMGWGGGTGKERGEKKRGSPPDSAARRPD